MNRRRLAVIIGITVSVIFFWLAFRQLQPAAFRQSLQQANVGLLLLGMGVYGVAVTIITLRWQFLLRALADVPLRKLFPLVCIGYMGNNIYPFRSGEILRVFLLRRNHDVPFGRGATTVIVERVFDGLVMLTFLIVPLTFIDAASEPVRRIATVTAPLFIIALTVFFVLAARPNWLRGLAKRVANVLPGRPGDIVNDLSEEIVTGLRGLRSPADLAGTIVSSYATWAVEASVYWIVAFAFSLDLSYTVMLVVVGVVNLAGLIPAAPGNLGVFEFFASEVLTTVGVPEATAVAYAIVVHIVIWLPPTVAGFFFLAREGLNLSALTRADELQQSVTG
ncbi:MAG: lysylphosphatidylglycerol synthase transmembrane domain-containing protein [Chloroflexota bacterium]